MSILLKLSKNRGMNVKNTVIFATGIQNLNENFLNKTDYFGRKRFFPTKCHTQQTGVFYKLNALYNPTRLV